MTIESAIRFIFLAQLIYILSISRFFMTYFSHISYGGLVMEGIFTRFLSKSRIFLIYITWISSLTFVIIFQGNLSIILSILCLFYSRYFFIYLRYKSIGRGNGAPGFMSYWTILYAVILKFLLHESISYGAVLILMKLDFALIMLSAGIYKYKTGYLRGRGIEFGMINQMWSWAHSFFKKIALDSYFYRLLNSVSVIAEIAIFVLLILPQLHQFAAFLIFLMFTLLLFVRLGTLPITMFALSYLFFVMGSNINSSESASWLKIVALMYGISLILSLLWSWFYFLEFPLPKYAAPIFRFAYSLTGSIIWSVFSARITENYVQIFRIEGKKRILVTPPDNGVHSGITLTTIATLTDYFPDYKEEQRKRAHLYLEAMFPQENNLEIQFTKIRRLDAEFYYTSGMVIEHTK